MVDAVVIGAGPNGLTAANRLTDAGWDVVVLEAEQQPGGAVRSGPLTAAPGFVHDWFSAFYPLAVASPALRRLNLEDHGLRWLRAPIVLAHPTPDGNCACIHPDQERTAASLDAYAPGDGAGWAELLRRWDRVQEPFLAALLSPFPPLRAGALLATRLGPHGLLDLARLALTPARQLAREHFSGEGAALLLAGNALHADLMPETAGSGLFGWMLCSLAQRVGFPVPEGGASELTAALVRRFEKGGGQLRCAQRVTEVVVRAGRAVGVRTAGGDEVRAERAVIADVAAPHLYQRLLARADLPDRLARDLARFQWDAGTVKVDWALSAPIPWASADARRAGTLHLADSVDHLSRWATDLATGTLPGDPFLLVGQQSMTDPSRQPEGAETAWAYTHVPRQIQRDAAGTVSGRWDSDDTSEFAARMESRVEALAPGFTKHIIARHVFTPPGLEAADANLDGGAINGGTSQLHQQLVFRPTPGLGRSETAVKGLFLASSSAHPGGGVHGACGDNAARAALFHGRLFQLRGSHLS
ncbi:MAG: phytoene desaturase family protein [Acidimicrobiales bacterium]